MASATVCNGLRVPKGEIDVVGSAVTLAMTLRAKADRRRHIT